VSIVVAVKKNGQVAVAADTMHSTGSRREHPDNIVQRSKLRRVGRALIGGVGWSVYDNILDHYLASRRRPPVLKDERTIFDFFLKFWKVLGDKYQLVNEQTDRDDRSPFCDLDSEFMVVNPRGIYHVSSDLSVMQFEKYVAIGSGDKYAYGTLHALYGSRQPALAVARAAAEAAVHFDQSCGGELELVEV
jgi:ATP-dependent protease HslVU (ClpYQ) peptidase subunit